MGRISSFSCEVILAASFESSATTDRIPTRSPYSPKFYETKEFKSQRNSSTNPYYLGKRLSEDDSVTIVHELSNGVGV